MVNLFVASLFLVVVDQSRSPAVYIKDKICTALKQGAELPFSLPGLGCPLLKAFNLRQQVLYANGGSQAKLKTQFKTVIFCAVLPISDKSRKGDGAACFLLLSGGTLQPTFKPTAPARLPQVDPTAVNVCLPAVTMVGHAFLCTAHALPALLGG